MHVCLSVPLTICNASLSLIDVEKKVGGSSGLYKLYEKAHGNRRKTLSEHLRRSPVLLAVGSHP